jgi:hypothetical protein
MSRICEYNYTEVKIERKTLSVTRLFVCQCMYACVQTCMYGRTYSHFHNDWFFFSKKRKYGGTQRCRKISNRCISVTGSNVEFFFQAKKTSIIMKMRVDRRHVHM